MFISVKYILMKHKSGFLHTADCCSTDFCCVRRSSHYDVVISFLFFPVVICFELMFSYSRLLREKTDRGIAGCGQGVRIL